MDFSMTTKDVILWNIKCLRFDSLNGTKKRCFPKATQGYSSLRSLSCKTCCVNQPILLWSYKFR